MRTLVDQTTGEIVEVLDAQVKGLEPYDYREAKAATMRASVGRAQAEQEYKQAIYELAEAERAYRQDLATEVLLAKHEHGATNAEVVAKGTSKVPASRERLTIADGMRYAALERIRRSDADRTSLSQLIAWSRAVSTVPWGDQ